MVTGNLRITAAAQNGRLFLARILLAVCLGETRVSVLSTALQRDYPPSHSVTRRSPLIMRIRGHHSARKQAWWFARRLLSIPQKWHTSPPIIFHWPKQVTWFWLMSKGRENVILAYVQNKKTWKYLWTALMTPYGPLSLPPRRLPFRDGEWGFAPRLSFLCEDVALLVCTRDSLESYSLRREALERELQACFCPVHTQAC